MDFAYHFSKRILFEMVSNRFREQPQKDVLFNHKNENDKKRLEWGQDVIAYH